LGDAEVPLLEAQKAELARRLSSLDHDRTQAVTVGNSCAKSWLVGARSDAGNLYACLCTPDRLPRRNKP
jgi:hypothetical protein